MRVQDYLVVEARLKDEMKNLDGVLARLTRLGLYPEIASAAVGGFPLTDENAARIVGSYLQDFYNCFEHMAKVVARLIDGAGQRQGPDWRSELLRQMSTAAGLKRDLAGFMDQMSRALDIPSPGLS